MKRTIKQFIGVALLWGLFVGSAGPAGAQPPPPPDEKPPREIELEAIDDPTEAWQRLQWLERWVGDLREEYEAVRETGEQLSERLDRAKQRWRSDELEPGNLWRRRRVDEMMGQAHHAMRARRRVLFLSAVTLNRLDEQVEVLRTVTGLAEGPRDDEAAQALKTRWVDVGEMLAQGKVEAAAKAIFGETLGEEAHRVWTRYGQLGDPEGPGRDGMGPGGRPGDGPGWRRDEIDHGSGMGGRPGEFGPPEAPEEGQRAALELDETMRSRLRERLERMEQRQEELRRMLERQQEEIERLKRLLGMEEPSPPPSR